MGILTCNFALSNQWLKKNTLPTKETIYKINKILQIINIILSNI